MVFRKFATTSVRLFLAYLTLLFVLQFSADAATASAGSSEPIAYQYGTCDQVPDSLYLKHEGKAEFLSRSEAASICYPTDVSRFDVISARRWCESFYCGWGCWVLTAGVTVTADYSCSNF